MSANSFGEVFRLTSFGESHGAAIGGIIEGCPAGLTIDIDAIQKWLDRRRPGQSEYTSPRDETDKVQILSGIFESKTLGTPIGFIIPNRDMRPADYAQLRHVYRPSHADFTYDSKYGHRDYRGGGRSSARETAVRVVAGAIAMQLLATEGVHIKAWVCRVGEVELEDKGPFDDSAIYASKVRCPAPETALEMQREIEKVRADGDSIGGAVACVAYGVPPGWGEPVFDKLHAQLGKAMLSINAVKAFETGIGTAAASMRGSEHNDAFLHTGEGPTTATNRSGGIQGGISNGQEITTKVSFKPVATIATAQQTVTDKGEPVMLEATGRHDPCVVPRAVPIVASMMAITLADFYLRQRLSRLSL
jgi:chorismate synthase